VVVADPDQRPSRREIAELDLTVQGLAVDEALGQLCAASHTLGSGFFFHARNILGHRKVDNKLLPKFPRKIMFFDQTYMSMIAAKQVCRLFAGAQFTMI
jgi:hypothetical protein